MISSSWGVHGGKMPRIALNLSHTRPSLSVRSPSDELWTEGKRVVSLLLDLHPLESSYTFIAEQLENHLSHTRYLTESYYR